MALRGFTDKTQRLASGKRNTTRHDKKGLRGQRADTGAREHGSHGVGDTGYYKMTSKGQTMVLSKGETEVPSKGETKVPSKGETKAVPKEETGERAKRRQASGENGRGEQGGKH